MNPHELIDRVADWSRRDDRVIAAGVCGSHARGEARPDSDIDFCILTADPRALLDDASWIFEIGANARVADDVEDYNLVRSVRTWYGPTEVEFGITGEAWVQLPIDAETAGVINDGLQILYDPEERLANAVDCAATALR